MVLFLFNNVIYVLLLLRLCILILCLCMATLTGFFSVLFPQLYGKCRGKTLKDGARPALFLIFVLYVWFVLCRSLCCVCVYCTTASGWLPNCS